MTACFISERELASVVCLSSVCNVRAPYAAAVEIFGNFYTPFCTLAIRRHPRKILRRSSQGNPSVGDLNARGIVKYSDFSHFEGYISQTVQDSRQVSINH